MGVSRSEWVCLFNPNIDELDLHQSSRTVVYFLRTTLRIHGHRVSMVKPRRRLHAKRQSRNSNQVQRRLAYKARIQKEKYTKHQRTWRHTSKSYSKRPLQRKFSRDETPNLCHNASDHGSFINRSNSKSRDRHVNCIPTVTFKEKLADENGEHTFHHQESPGNGLQFRLEYGKVDVSQVLGNLGVTKLQYEYEPGVWRALKAHSSGKSIDTFHNNQQVYYRAEARPDARTSHHGARKIYNWVDSWLVEGDTEEAYNARVSRIVQKTGKGRIGVGTMVRVDTPLIPGLMLTCRHCVEVNEGGSINEKLLAFGGPVTVLYVSNKYDLALCEGPPGPDGFRLAVEGEEVKGREIRMLSFPWHVDLVYGLMEDVPPTQVHGNVCMFSPDGCEMPMEVDALGTYMGGFPASSGGAVTLSSKVLCGIHVGVIWHDKDELSMPLVLGSKGHVEPHKNTIHMQLCARRRKIYNDNKDSTSNNDSGPTTMSRKYCSSSHGYLATYVSSSHIEEAFQDYLENIRVLESNSERY